MEHYETVIVGAGPAGLRCAKVLAGEGREVLVLEKDKVFGKKVCAGGITAPDFQAGIPKRLVQRSFKKIYIHTSKLNTVIEHDTPIISTITRRDLGDWMASEAMKSGTIIWKESELKDFNEQCVVLKDGKKISYDYLVGADGSSSTVRRLLGVPTTRREVTFQYWIPKRLPRLDLYLDFKRFGPLFIYVFPHKRQAAVGTGVDLSKSILNRASFPVGHVREEFTKWCRSRYDLSKAKYESMPINFDYRGHQHFNKFLIGDAGGFASGLTGEGISFGIRSGEDVARKIIDDRYDCPQIHRIIKLKRTEEAVLRSHQLSRSFAGLEFDMIAHLLRHRWLSDYVLEHLD